MALTIKQKLFIEHYLETRNAYQAAKMAGYSGDDHTLRSMGWENLTKPDIRAEIDSRLKGHILSANEVLRELSEVAFAPWKEFVDLKYGDEGQVISATLLLKDKLRSLELVGKYHKLFTDKVESEVKVEQVDPRQHYETLREEFKDELESGAISDKTLREIATRNTGAKDLGQIG